MTRVVEILIDNERVDISDTNAVPLTLDFEIDDVSEVGKRKGSGSSQMYKLPGTSNNIKIFENFGVQKTDVRTTKTFKNAIIKVDGIPIFYGLAIVRCVTTTGRKTHRTPIEYEVAFLSNNADWFSLMDGLSILDLSFDDHDLTSSLVQAKFDEFYEKSPTNNFAYTLIKWKDWKFQGSNYVVIEDFTPALFILDILVKSFAAIGYSISSTFLFTDFFKRLIMPVPLRKYGTNFANQYVDMRAAYASGTVPFNLNFSGGFVPETKILLFDDDSTAPNFDPADNYDTGVSPGTDGKYYIPCAGKYTITGHIEFFITAINSDSDLSLQIFRQGDATPLAEFVLPDADTIAVSTLVTMEVSGTFNLSEADIGKHIVIAIKYDSSDVAPYAATLNVQSGFFEISADRLCITEDKPVIFGELLPDFRLTDFINGVVHMFDLYIQTDSATNEVTIEPRNDFFNGLVDWTDKVDICKNAKRCFIKIDKKLNFKYADDSNDDTLDQLNNGQVIELLSARYTTDEPTSERESTSENPFFSGCVHLRDKTIAGFATNDTPPQIPLIWPENYQEIDTVSESDYDFKPRILYHKGLVTFPVDVYSSPEGSITLFNTVNPTSRDAYPLSFMVNYYDDGTDPSLSYGQETVRDGNVVDGLVKNYHLSFLATLNQGVEVNEHIKFKLTDILQLDFQKKVQILNEIFILQKVSKYSPIKIETTKVILLDDQTPSQGDVDAIDSSGKQSLLTSE